MLVLQEMRVQVVQVIVELEQQVPVVELQVQLVRAVLHMLADLLL
jgi:hypothetical protein